MDDPSAQLHVFLNQLSPTLIDEYERILQPTMRKAAELLKMEQELPGLRAELSEARDALRLLADQVPAMNQLLCHLLQQVRATEAKLHLEEQKSRLLEQQLQFVQLIPEAGLPHASKEKVAVKKEELPIFRFGHHLRPFQPVENVGFRPYRPEHKKGGAGKKKASKIYRPY
ncbi:hypothetical protein PRIPAC_71538 [Pristionchus pacificus]|uniref:Uncharacterized protein n=1 Tax=Pristionchus pacificus TaxID=54126 RepID=A0A454XVU7_PRIPA|nr:hypothetical protein PRIPAC_71538 [Pristionchus pacificus]|eukprot:PDM71787.1 hypothetical protein PRIPAC_38194 [Pristionchus pacificus]